VNPDDFDLHNRLVKLEKQNRWMKQFGSVALAVVAAIAIMVRLPRRRPSRRTSSC